MTRHLAPEMHGLGVAKLRNSQLLRALRALIPHISRTSCSTQTYSELP